MTGLEGLRLSRPLFVIIKNFYVENQIYRRFVFSNFNRLQ